MPWLNPTQYNPDDICVFCHTALGRTKAIYKTPCNHVFHNDCFNESCETHNGNINCPICHVNLGIDLDYYPCIETSNFKERNLGRVDGAPIFTDQHVLAIYNGEEPASSQPRPGLHQLGGKKQKSRRNKRNKRHKRNKKTKRRYTSKRN